MNIQQIALQRENERHQKRQEQIKKLLRDDDPCFERETAIVEAMRKKLTIRAEESHRERLNQINADCDAALQAIVDEHLSKAEPDEEELKRPGIALDSKDEVAEFFDGK